MPPATTVHVALIARDEQQNPSPLSNVVSAATTEGVVIAQEGAEDDVSDWEQTGLWHVTERRAAEGARSFWYGQETTGNYDTGAANAGTLTSPVIDLTEAVDPILLFDQFVDVEESSLFDLANVVVTDADDPSVTATFPKAAGTTGGAFAERAIDLGDFEGRRIRLTFAFDTVDDLFNATEGWFVDAIAVVGSEAGASCAHDVCEPGDPLDPTCSTCVETVCAADPYCCTTAWDALCVEEAQTLCGATCEAPPPTCDHPVCEAGTALDPSCDPCAQTVCEADAFCCTTFWDRVCVQEAEELCGVTCEGCAHDLCDVGDALSASCDPCAETVCQADPYCCENAWDARCVAEAASMCQLQCEQCTHDLCQSGDALVEGCDPCVSAVCAADPYCCATAWDSRCIEQVTSACGLSCTSAR